ncbi:MAG: DUF1905 domain-containing protein [Kangiellaceae bacterium]|nr:DUF1905 domain-containing protein [Kangiellaceae bacterium]
MIKAETLSKFQAKLLQPISDHEDLWAFIVLPKEASAKLSRRGRLNIGGTINGHEFTLLLEPDGQKSHWLKINKQLMKGAKTTFGELADFEIWGLEDEPEPEIPSDFLKSLKAFPEAEQTWNNTTTIARIDWIHWITSAKQAKTRTKRIHDACDMLSSGKKRVCCFDPSGFYSKAFKAPEAIN